MSTAMTTTANDIVPDADVSGGVDFGLPPTFSSAPSHLSKKQKAAIIVRLLLAEGAQLALQDLPDVLQAELIRQISDLRYIDRATLKSVIDEFAGEIEDIGLSFPGGIEGALSVLEGSISPATAARMRKMAGVKISGDPWISIAGLDPELLLGVLETESVEVAAVLLSKLKVSIAAELLGRLPGPRARKVAYAVSLTGAVDPEIVEKIGRALAEQLDAQPAKAFETGPVERVGAILNFSPAATRDEVLSGLDEDDKVFAGAVRKAIFTFGNIPDRIDPRDVPKITKEIEQSVLVTALASASGPLEPAAEFILGAMSKRMAEQIREEMDELGAVKQAAGEAAMNEIVATIRKMEANGEVLLIAEDED